MNVKPIVELTFSCCGIVFGHCSSSLSSSGQRGLHKLGPIPRVEDPAVGNWSSRLRLTNKAHFSNKPQPPLQGHLLQLFYRPMGKRRSTQLLLNTNTKFGRVWRSICAEIRQNWSVTTISDSFIQHSAQMMWILRVYLSILGKKKIVNCFFTLTVSRMSRFFVLELICWRIIAWKIILDPRISLER